MKKSLRIFGALMLMLLVSSSSLWAQTSFEGSASADQAGWATSDVTYDMEEVASALGYADAAALYAAFDAQEVTISAPDAEGNLTSTPTSYYTRNGVDGFSYGCWWLNAEGKVVAAWDSEGVTFANHFDYDESNIIIHLMQNDPSRTNPGEYTAVITLAANEKTATLSSTLTVNALAPFPTPVRSLSDLNIVDVQSIEINQKLMTNWGTNPEFSVDLSALVDAIKEEEGEDYPCEAIMTSNAAKMVGVELYDATTGKAGNALFIGKEDADFTANGGGFWLKRGTDGGSTLYKSDWGANPDVFYENVSYDAANHLFKGDAGQMINKFSLGDTFDFNLYFIYGDKAVKGQFIFTVKEDESASQMPTPVTEIASLNIVETAEVEITQPVMKDWGTNPEWRVSGAKLLEACGVEGSVFADGISKMVHTQVWDSNAEAAGEETSATENFTANAPGYWFQHASIVDEETDEYVASPDCYIGNYGSSDFFTEYIAFDASTSEFHGNAGQMINKFKGGERFNAVLYFIYGDKAMQVNLHFNVEKPADIPVEDMVKVGETADMTWAQEPRADYTGDEHRIADMSNVATLLGCAANAMVLKCKLPDGTVTDQYTTSTTSVENGTYGFWIDETGAPITSNVETKSFYVEYHANTGTLTVGQMPNNFQIGDEFGTTLWLCNNEKYYEINVKLSIEDLQKADPADYHEVGSYSFNFRSLIDGSWEVTEHLSPALDMTEVAEKIGTDNYVVYAISDGEFSKNYTCTPYPGFWFSPDGTQVVGWGSAKIGICFQNNGLEMYKNPVTNADDPSQDTKVGDKFKHNIYLVNEYTGAYVTITANVEFVDKIVNYQVTDEKTFTVEMNENGVGTLEFDGTNVVRMLATNIENFWANGSILPLKGEGEYAAVGEYANDAEMGFDANGYVLPGEEVENAAFMISAEMDDNVGSRLYVDGILPEGTVVPEDGIVYKTTLVFQYEEYRYIMHIQVKYPTDITTAINGISTAKANKGIYNLNGQRVANPTKGIYIVDGKKVVIK